MLLFIFKEQMWRQLENIQVMEYYSDPKLDPTAPHDLHSEENMHDLDLYQRMCMSTMTYHLRRQIQAYNCAVL